MAFDGWAWQMLSRPNDGLVGSRRVAGRAGDQLVPTFGAALPVRSGGGKTYTFHLRPSLKYSTGAPVRPEDFRRAIERVFMINKQGNPGIPPFYAGIAGTARCERNPAPCNLPAGIVAHAPPAPITFPPTPPAPQFL